LSVLPSSLGTDQQQRVAGERWDRQTDGRTDGQRYVNARDTKLLDAAVVIFNALYLSFLYIGAMA